MLRLIKQDSFTKILTRIAELAVKKDIFTVT